LEICGVEARGVGLGQFGAEAVDLGGRFGSALGGSCPVVLAFFLEACGKGFVFSSGLAGVCLCLLTESGEFLLGSGQRLGCGFLGGEAVGVRVRSGGLGLA
jgi:hypothetical protein